MKCSGLLLHDEALLHAMEPGEEFRFLPCNRNKKGELVGDLASTEDLQALKQYVSKQVAHLSDDIYSGELEPNPYFIDTKHHACGWCAFRSICADMSKKRILENFNAESFWERIKEG